MFFEGIAKIPFWGSKILLFPIFMFVLYTISSKIIMVLKSRTGGH